MTIRQTILKLFYPLLMRSRPGMVFRNETHAKPAHALYDLAVTLNTSEVVELSAYRGRKIMFVNTASDCGFTNQYADLEKLHRQSGDRLVIIGFPANDFKEQEKGSDEEIARFCQVNFGVTFPLAKKSVVIKGSDQNPVFRWLTDKKENGWNGRAPSWNFTKFLVNESGELTHFFAPGVSPLDEQVLRAIGKVPDVN